VAVQSKANVLGAVIDKNSVAGNCDVLKTGKQQMCTVTRTHSIQRFTKELIYARKINLMRRATQEHTRNY
jgi:hypothetical protein